MNHAIHAGLLGFAAENERIQAVQRFKQVEDFQVVSDASHHFLRRRAVRNLECQGFLEALVAQVHRLATVVDLVEIIGEVDRGIDFDELVRFLCVALEAFENNGFIHHVGLEESADRVFVADCFSDRVAIERDRATGIDNVAKLRAGFGHMFFGLPPIYFV